MNEWPITPDARRLYRARLRLQINKALRKSLLEQMAGAALSVPELARRLAWDETDVEAAFCGEMNITIAELSWLCAALEVEPRLVLTPYAEIEREPPK